MIYTFTSTKGGAGKSTIVIQMATFTALQNGPENVAIIDTDTQKSSYKGMLMRLKQSHKPQIDATTAKTPEELQAALKQYEGRQVFIDCAGFDGAVMREALINSDVVAVPVVPRGFDIWAVDDIKPIIDEARRVKGGFKGRAVAFLSMADPSGTANQQAADYIRNVNGIEYIDTPIVRRNAFSFASLYGLCVSEDKPLDKKAVAELTALYQAIIK